MNKKIASVFIFFVLLLTIVYILTINNNNNAAASNEESGACDNCSLDMSASAVQNVVFNGKSTYNVSYGNSEYNKLDIFQPTDSLTSTTAYPAIIVIHGGGWSAGAKEHFAKLSQTFANKGYVVFNINYRLSPSVDYTGLMDDVQLAVRWVRAHAKEYNIDPNRVGSYGNSAGGQLSALLATAETRNTSLPYSDYSSKVNCAVNSVGPTNFIYLRRLFLEKGDTRFIQTINNLFGGNPAEKLNEYQEFSPAFQLVLKKSSAPILTLHGEGDSVIPVEDTDRFELNVQKNYPDNTTYFIYLRYGKGSEHNLYNAVTDEEKKAAANASSFIINFFDKHLSGTEKNHAPLFFPLLDRGIAFGTTSEINIKVIDLDGDDVDVTMENYPAGSTLTKKDEYNFTFSWKPDNSECDLANVNFIATDGKLSTTTPLKLTLDTGTAPFHRFWNYKITDHFYTLNDDVKDKLISDGWKYENFEGYLHVKSTDKTVPLYRSWNAKVGDHFYTSDAEFRDRVVAFGYKYEGIAGYIHPNQLPGTVPLYRFKNDSIQDNFYTISEAAKEKLLNTNYKYKDITGYVDTGIKVCQ
ncbi:MAG: alpha/beta hydrolase fold domain-containing protein [Candidatus Moranbacteria bacterium]|nr:alpha/beta hydrolase fold domain-containing protein [Candidatus Moranbacteria bacterium]